MCPFHTNTTSVVSSRSLPCRCQFHRSAESQIRWTKHTDNPVLRVITDDPRHPFAYRYKYAPTVREGPPGTRVPDVVREPDHSTTMGGGPSPTPRRPTVSSWYHYDRNPVLKTDDYPAFDSQWVIDPDVIMVGDQYFCTTPGMTAARGKGALRNHPMEFTGNAARRTPCSPSSLGHGSQSSAARSTR